MEQQYSKSISSLPFEIAGGFLGITSVFWMTKDLISNYKLERSLSAKNEIVHASPELAEIATSKRLCKNGIKKRQSIEINTFYKTMCKVPGFNIENFKRNLKALSIDFQEPKKFFLANLLENTNTIAYLSFLDETRLQIVLTKGDEYYSLYHELLHMASSRASNNVFYVGFRQMYRKGKKLVDIGDGLNEGYTEFLTNRYFEDFVTDDVYELVKKAVSLLELILGKDTMEKWYFDSNLHDLVSSLCKYDTRENVMRFLKMLDLLEIRPGMIETPIARNYTNLVYKQVLTMLIKWKISKVKEDALNEEFDLEEVKMDMNSFLVEAFTTVCDEHKAYGLTENEQEKMLLLVNMLFDNLSMQKKKP